MKLQARTCRICGKPKGCFAFRNIDEIAREAGIPIKEHGSPNYAHPACMFGIKAAIK